MVKSDWLTRRTARTLKDWLLTWADRAQERCRDELQRQLAAAREARERNGAGPRRLAVATLHTPEIGAYSELACAVNRLYCDRHQYDYVEIRGLLDREAAPTWHKPMVLGQLLQEKKTREEKHYDYVMWMDADAAFNNHEIAVEEILDLWPDHDFLISMDPANVIPRECCAGVFIVRNTSWSRQFLDLWLAAGRTMNGGKYFDRRRRGKKDQVILNRLLRMPDHAPHVKVLPSCYLNEDAHRARGPASFILHAMASSMAERRALFAELYSRFHPPASLRT